MQVERAPITPPTCRCIARLPPSPASTRPHPPAGRSKPWPLLRGFDRTRPQRAGGGELVADPSIRKARLAVAPTSRRRSSSPSTDQRQRPQHAPRPWHAMRSKRFFFNFQRLRTWTTTQKLPHIATRAEALLAHRSIRASQPGGRATTSGIPHGDLDSSHRSVIHTACAEHTRGRHGRQHATTLQPYCLFCRLAPGYARS